MSALQSSEDTSETTNVLVTPYQNLSIVKAGAGAGKTFHIEKTLVEWIRTGKVEANRILAVTFTNAAANELVERIRLALLKAGMYQESKKVRHSQISTIHGFGLDIVSRFSYEQGMSPAPRQLTDSEQNVLIRLSLTKIEAIGQILDDLPGWGYKLKKSGSDWIDASVQLKSQVLEIISSFRNLGTVDKAKQARILVTALERVKNIYGFLGNEKTLNDSLWKAVEEIQSIYDVETLEAEWGSNAQTRAFVHAVFACTEENVKTNWSLWTQLQSIETAPNIFDKKTGNTKHKNSKLAYAVWHAADKLSIHPGPLKHALKHIEILLSTAFETVDNYQQLKKQAGLVDFSDMVHIAEFLTQNNILLEEIKSDYDCLVIDEFQDTNPLQFSLLWQIKKSGIPALIVGDIKQSVMGFQGADSRLFETLIKNTGQTQNESVSELDSNWRSTAELVKFTNNLGDKLFGDGYFKQISRSCIESDLSPIKIIEFPKDPWSTKSSKNKFGFSTNGPKVIAAEIKRILGSDLMVTDKNNRQRRSIRPSDIAVLAYSHTDLARIAEFLRCNGIQPKIEEKGWLKSKSIIWLQYALSYLADPRDQHSLLYLKMSMDPESDLEAELKSLFEQEKPRKIQGELADLLKSLQAAVRFLSIPQIVKETINTLKLWDKYAFSAHFEDGQQERANLLKLISLAEEFENAEFESLQAQGIFGKGLSSFLCWLSVNESDFDAQPHVSGDNKNAVALSTWHASKGLEWPIVIVMSMAEVMKPRLPKSSIEYDQVKGLKSMLNNAFCQVLTEFEDSNTREKFINSLKAENKLTLKNLTYVVMTRAREHLILPWFDPGKEDNMISLLSDVDLAMAERVTAFLPEEQTVVGVDSAIVPFGRITLNYNDIPNAQVAQVAPSLILEINQKNGVPPVQQSEIQSFNYANNLDFSPLEKDKNAAEIGTLIHRVYEVMLTQPNLSEQLFALLPELNSRIDLKEALLSQIQEFKKGLFSKFAIISLNTEVPILAKTDEGVIINGIIDLLAETEKGYWVVDHKTDRKPDFDQFAHHYAQLLGYSKFTKMKKPVLGLCVNWVSAGILQYVEAQPHSSK
ncbi:MAG: UvrD-helicase domain-containing protein [SAR324 cluster bacterium]|nr:UvrD-helicase domain-containing protein [SAR324 cluster bacterium]